LIKKKIKQLWTSGPGRSVRAGG